MITYFTKTPVFFCNTYCSWQKGSVENANGLLREYIPKKADFNTISQEMLDEIVKQINLRPRKRLNYFTPFEMFWEKSCISE
jgi:IS30 family transposase